jgi:hypothetical protein
VLHLEEKVKEKGEFIPCWKYYQCPEQILEKCPAFNEGFEIKYFRDCWLHIKEKETGGPGNHGPCSSCEWNNSFGLCFNNRIIEDKKE